jgi:hypothetical protein
VAVFLDEPKSTIPTHIRAWLVQVDEDLWVTLWSASAITPDYPIRDFSWRDLAYQSDGPVFIDLFWRVGEPHQPVIKNPNHLSLQRHLRYYSEAPTFYQNDLTTESLNYSIYHQKRYVFGSPIIIIISVIMSLLLEHRSFLWISHKENGPEPTTRAQCGLVVANDCKYSQDQRLNVPSEAGRSSR